MRLRVNPVNLVYPEGIYCQCCGNYIDNTRTYSLCDHCIRRMNFNMTDLYGHEGIEYFRSACAVMGYGLYEKQLIFDLKYNGKTYIARNMAQIMYDCILEDFMHKGESLWLKNEIIIPVPIHAKRLKERGFNQAAKIAFHFGKKAGMKVIDDGLIRIRDTDAQRALSARERKSNMEGAFKVNESRRSIITGKRILLIDDIYTTGATASHCGEVLVNAGAKTVDFLAFCSAKNKHHEFYACKEGNK